MYESRTVSSGSIEIHAERTGDGSGPALLLVMGALASGSWWPDAFVRRLADAGFTVIRYDHRDTGQSTALVEGPPPYGPPPYGFSDFAADARAVLDAYGVERAHYVGMSMGGLIGQILAVAAPDRLASLTLIAAPFFGQPQSPRPPADVAVLTELGRLAEVDWADRAAAAQYFAGLWRLNAGEGRSYEADRIEGAALRDAKRMTHPGSMFHHLATSWEHPDRDRQAEIATPTLVVQGGADRIVAPAHADDLCAVIRGAQRLDISGMGHDLHSDDHAAIVDAIIAHARGADDRL